MATRKSMERAGHSLRCRLARSRRSMSARKAGGKCPLRALLRASSSRCAFLHYTPHTGTRVSLQ